MQKKSEEYRSNLMELCGELINRINNPISPEEYERLYDEWKAANKEATWGKIHTIGSVAWAGKFRGPKHYGAYWNGHLLNTGYRITALSKSAVSRNLNKFIAAELKILESADQAELTKRKVPKNIEDFLRECRGHEGIPIKEIVKLLKEMEMFSIEEVPTL